MSFPVLTDISVEVASGTRYIGATNGSNSVGVYYNNGTPEGAVVANPGALCHDYSNGDVYVKKTGAGNTGWLVLATGTGSTNLTIGTVDATTVEVLSNSGTDAVIPAATGTTAGVMPAADKVKTDFITVTQAVDLDAMETDISEHQTLLGVADGSTNLGTFTGSIVTDNVSIKAALQELETAVTANILPTLASGLIFVGDGSNEAAAVAMSGDVTIDGTGVTTVVASSATVAGKVELATPAEVLVGTDSTRAVTAAGVDGYATALVGNASGVQHLGAFTGAIITDNVSVKTALQELETAVEALPTRVQLVVADIAARDALTGATGDIVFVTDASADVTVTAGSAFYIWSGVAWVKFSEGESLDVVTNLAVANQTITTLDITSSSGADVTVPQAVADSVLGANDGTAGLLNAADKLKLDGLGGYAETYGGSAVQAITHSLGSLDVVVNVYRLSDGVQVQPQIARTSANVVTLTHSIAPAAAAYRVVVSRAV